MIGIFQEHYIDNLIRPKEKKNNQQCTEIEEGHHRMAIESENGLNELCRLNLPKRIGISLNRDLDWFYDNVTVPLTVMQFC